MVAQRKPLGSLRYMTDDTTAVTLSFKAIVSRHFFLTGRN
jgi:hypothetical protein